MILLSRKIDCSKLLEGVDHHQVAAVEPFEVAVHARQLLVVEVLAGLDLHGLQAGRCIVQVDSLDSGSRLQEISQCRQSLTASVPALV